MRNLFRFFIFALIGLTSVLVLQAKVPTAHEMLYNSAQGKDFWIAIPPNEADGQPLGNTGEIAIELYVTSSKNCTVSMEIPGQGIKVTKKVTAMNITTFSSIKGDLSFQWEVRTSEQVLDMGVWIHADQPISVYLLNHRFYTADGLLCIPITSCGKEYIHLSYYDFYENLTGKGEPRGGGFIVCAGEDNTKINIQLRGVGGAIGQTLGGHHIGDTWSVILQRGQIYCVMGDGMTRGQFDISGSRVTSSKPVGFISFHKRVLIPSFDLYNGRNNLMEMMPPVSAWGKNYTTCEFKRKDHGDYFRVIAAEDNTNFSLKWYDPNSTALIGQRSGVLKKSGDWFEYLEVYVPQGVTNTLESIRGTSIWTADKPILVMQYSYSTDWDNDPQFDPFMVLVVPTEQYIPSSVFQTPDASAQFLTNWFNIIAIGDSTDMANTKLKSLTMDGKPIWSLVPNFVYNRIPTTNLYWAKVPSAPGAHVVKGDTKFGGYIYGFSSADGYGWPAAMAINTVAETDTLPPVLTQTSDCGDFKIRGTEFRNGGTNDNPRQVDQGIVDITLLDSSYNYVLQFTGIQDPNQISLPSYDSTFRAVVIDKTKDAFAIIQVTDKYGNYSLDTVYYSADKLILDPLKLDFKTQRVGTTRTLDVSIINTGDSAVKVKSTTMMTNSVFTIVNGSAPPEFTIDPKGSHNVTIQYLPVTESQNDSQRDNDSIIIQTQCAVFKWPVTGRGVLPRIVVQDWDFGSVVVNKKVCKDQQSGEGLKISNPGTDTLIITGIQNAVAPFEISTPFTPALPIIIPPQQSVFLMTVCFTPNKTGPFNDVLLFNNNAVGPDSLGVLNGRGIQPGPVITRKDWYQRRVLTQNDSQIVLTNLGSSPVTVTDIQLSGPTNNFTITSSAPPPSPGNPIILQPLDSVNISGDKQIYINVRFTPQAEGTDSIYVVPVFDPADSIPAGIVKGALTGTGFLPKIIVIGDTLQTPILLNTQDKDTAYVTIMSTSTSSDLFVQSIQWSPASVNPGDFRWVNNPPANIIIPMGTQIKLPVIFTGLGTGTRVVTADVVSDAAPGPSPNPRVTTSANVVGYVFDVGAKVDSLNFGQVLLCDQPVKQIHVTNIATSVMDTIASIIPLAGDFKNFAFVQTAPIYINKSSVKSLDIMFKPDKAGSYKATYQITVLSAGTVITLITQIQGVAYTVPIQLSLSTFDASLGLAPGFEIKPSVLMVNNNFNDSKITELHADIVYNTSWMRYFNAIDKGDMLDASWTVTATEKVLDATRTKLSIIAKSTATPPNPIVKAGSVIFIPHFQLLLSDTKEFKPDIQNITTLTRDSCVIPTGIAGDVVMNSCVINLRSIVISNKSYELNSIDPNPVTNNEVNIGYSVGIEANTRIEIINSIGAIVKVVTDETLKPGAYTNHADINNLSSGVYIIRMISGPFTDTKQMVITK